MRSARPQERPAERRGGTSAGWLNPEQPDVGDKGHGAVDALPHKAGGGGPMAGPAEREA